MSRQRLTSPRAKNSKSQFLKSSIQLKCKNKFWHHFFQNVKKIKLLLTHLALLVTSHCVRVPNVPFYVFPNIWATTKTVTAEVAIPETLYIFSVSSFKVHDPLFGIFIARALFSIFPCLGNLRISVQLILTEAFFISIILITILDSINILKNVKFILTQ